MFEWGAKKQVDLGTAGNKCRKLREWERGVQVGVLQ